jgi:enediyne biosynthesis protein E4
MNYLRLTVLLGLLSSGCGGSGNQKPAAGGSTAIQEHPEAGGTVVVPEASLSGGAPLFTDITAESGIRFRHFNDASGNRYLPETMGSGAAFFDYDGDGRADLYLVNGAPLKGDKSKAKPGALYRNLDGIHFQDVTAASGLDEPHFGMGAAVGDIDNDGFTDLFVSAVDGDRLYRNRGDGTFEDITRKAGLSDNGFSSSAAFIDYDRDGYLDLFVGRYVEWSPQSDIPCLPDGRNRSYCTPEKYKGQTSRLYRNLGGKRFLDMTRTAGIFTTEGKTLGAAVFDHNQDGWPDIAVANDTVRNMLFVNNGDGTFREAGIEYGMAYGESGAARGGMGIDTGDVDGDGMSDIVIGNFAQEMSALFRGSSRGFYADDAAPAGIGMETLMYLKFGTLLLDFDNDGWLDMVFANGHIEPTISDLRRGQSYAQIPQFFHNEGKGRFKVLRGGKGTVFSQPMVARGLASADIDNDGDLDLLFTQNGGPPVLMRNNSPKRAWIRLKLIGRKSNRTGYGCKVRMVAGKLSLTRQLSSGRSYLSACEPVLTIGLGSLNRVDRLEVTWPSGKIQQVSDPPLQQLLVIEEDPGL